MSNKKKIERYIYPAIFTYEDGCEIAVEFPDLDTATSGEDENEPIPEPTHLSDITLGKNQKSALIDVYMPSIRMANVNKSVNRTVTLPAWLNAAALERGLNFSQILQDALKQQINQI